MFDPAKHNEAVAGLLAWLKYRASSDLPTGAWLQYSASIKLFSDGSALVSDESLVRSSAEIQLA